MYIKPYVLRHTLCFVVDNSNNVASRCYSSYSFLNLDGLSQEHSGAMINPHGAADTVRQASNLLMRSLNWDSRLNI